MSSTPTSTEGDDALPATLDEPSYDVEVFDAPADAATPVGPRPPWYRRLDTRLVLASLAIAVGLVAIGYALTSAVTGNEAANYPAAVEEVSPVFDATQVPQQSGVLADLIDGYEGYLIIDGVTLPTIRQDEIGNIDVEPGEQVKVPPGAIFEPGNATLSFTPGDGQAIENFDAGKHTAVVVYWKTLDGEGSARSYTWTFTTV